MKNIILLLRPQQWVKNMFIFLPLFFHGDLTNVQMLTNTVIAFFCYSFAASSIYCFNDIYDVAADRKHPKKCKRPIASGAVSIPQAYGLMALMLFLSLNLPLGTSILFNFRESKYIMMQRWAHDDELRFIGDCST